ncbi:hypothetical protein BJ742DRAFT_575902 [Cladochytrium replicatum]|nr:hypothetical protein BJ742DRAFT_575902 [Cladochytrium replicatum]
MPIQSLPVSALWATVGSSFGVQFIVGAASIALENDIVYDLSGSITFGVCTFISLYYRQLASNGGLIALLTKPLETFASLPSPTTFHPRQLLLSAATLTWASRLGSYLFVRALRNKGDPRLDRIKKNPAFFLVMFAIQAVWVSMTALPVWLVNSVPAEAQPALEWKDYLGAALWAFGFIYEAVADAQKDAWARRRLLKKADDEPFIRTGLFARSRFPHYFGELTLWTGVYVVSLGLFANPTVRAAQAYYPSWTWLAAASGVAFETYLLTRLSGVPLTDRHHKKLHGNNPDYIKYKKETPMFFPKLW